MSYYTATNCSNYFIIISYLFDFFNLFGDIMPIFKEKIVEESYDCQ